MVVSFGADFLGAWVSPVHFSQQYAQFRKGNRPEGRGVLVQIEPKMTLTGANADRWIAVRPGTEGVLALGIINALGKAGLSIPADIAAVSKEYTAERVSKETDVSAEQIDKLAALLKERTRRAWCWRVVRRKVTRTVRRMRQPSRCSTGCWATSARPSRRRPTCRSRRSRRPWATVQR